MNRILSEKQVNISEIGDKCTEVFHNSIQQLLCKQICKSYVLKSL